MHKRNSDFPQRGFEVVAHADQLAAAVREQPKAFSSWVFWQKYLDRQDELLTARQAARGQ